MDAVAREAAVGLDLRLARAARADAAHAAPRAQTLEVRPQAAHARHVVLELGELDLHLALGAVGVVGEDVEDHRGAVDHRQLERRLEVALLARRQLVVAGDQVGVGRFEQGLELLHLARPEVEVGMRLVAVLDQLADHGRPRRCAGARAARRGRRPPASRRRRTRAASRERPGLRRRDATRSLSRRGCAACPVQSRRPGRRGPARAASRSGRAAPATGRTITPSSGLADPAAPARRERVGGVGGGARVELVERAVPQAAVLVDHAAARAAPRSAAAGPTACAWARAVPEQRAEDRVRIGLAQAPVRSAPPSTGRLQTPSRRGGRKTLEPLERGEQLEARPRSTLPARHRLSPRPGPGRAAGRAGRAARRRRACARSAPRGGQARHAAARPARAGPVGARTARRRRRRSLRAEPRAACAPPARPSRARRRSRRARGPPRRNARAA